MRLILAAHFLFFSMLSVEGKTVVISRDTVIPKDAKNKNIFRLKSSLTKTEVKEDIDLLKDSIINGHGGWEQLKEEFLKSVFPKLNSLKDKALTSR